jgi:hypothetical protein
LSGLSAEGSVRLTGRPSELRGLTINNGLLQLDNLLDGGLLTDVTINGGCIAFNRAYGVVMNHLRIWGGCSQDQATGWDGSSVGNTLIDLQTDAKTNNTGRNVMGMIAVDSAIVPFGYLASGVNFAVTSANNLGSGIDVQGGSDNWGLYTFNNGSLDDNDNPISGYGYRFQQPGSFSRNIASHGSKQFEDLIFGVNGDDVVFDGVVKLSDPLTGECFVNALTDNAPVTNNTCAPANGTTAGITAGAANASHGPAPDFVLSAGDNVLRNIAPVPTGDDTLTHEWGGFDATTCGYVRGATWSGSACTSTFLRDSFELLDDSVGNDNGLCESNETCVHTPNIGYYQGEGDLVSAGAFTDGAITGVTMLRYQTNGGT